MPSQRAIRYKNRQIDMGEPPLADTGIYVKHHFNPLYIETPCIMTKLVKEHPINHPHMRQQLMIPCQEKYFGIFVDFMPFYDLNVSRVL